MTRPLCSIYGQWCSAYPVASSPTFIAYFSSGWNEATYPASYETVQSRNEILLVAYISEPLERTVYS